MSTKYQLQIELAGSYPKIWRRVIVPSNTTFSDLHDIIQISMGWRDEFPFEFTINGTTVRDFGPELDMEYDLNDRDAMDCLLDDVVTMVKTRFTYIYNFENRWEHQITLEKIIHSEDESEVSVCVAGEKNCPPDDCGGISRFQEMLKVLADETHPEHDTIKKQLAEGIVPFEIDEINAALRDYAERWVEIHGEAEKTLNRLEGEDEEGEFDDPDDYRREYESMNHLKSPQDLFNDAIEKQELEHRIDDALIKENSVEYKTFTRLISAGHPEEKSRGMLLDALAIEWFYELKYGTDTFNDRYEWNLHRLPEKPAEVPSLDYAIQVIDKCTKGIPFAAIECLHNDTSPESTSAIIKALKNFSDHQYCWVDCAITPILYSFAAEGHLCEDLIDPVINLYFDDNHNTTDWLREQGQYLIGKLAQKYPDVAAQKVLTAMEKDAEVKGKHAVYYLFDVFDFCDLDKFKDRLIALLKRDDISWHDMLTATIAHLQIKEGLPVLQEQLARLKTKKVKKDSWEHANIVEIEEAIEQLETGEDPYPDISAPLCLSRGTTWREEFAEAEENFYDSTYLPEDNSDLNALDYTESYPSLLWGGPNHQQPIIKENKTGRNDPCPCGSGKKYKKCCLDKDLRGE